MTSSYEANSQSLLESNENLILKYFLAIDLGILFVVRSEFDNVSLVLNMEGHL